jgi:hypothetical protein
MRPSPVRRRHPSRGAHLTPRRARTLPALPPHAPAGPAPEECVDPLAPARGVALATVLGVGLWIVTLVALARFLR